MTQRKKIYIKRSVGILVHACMHWSLTIPFFCHCFIILSCSCALIWRIFRLMNSSVNWMCTTIVRTSLTHSHTNILFLNERAWDEFLQKKTVFFGVIRKVWEKGAIMHYSRFIQWLSNIQFIKLSTHWRSNVLNVMISHGKPFTSLDIQCQCDKNDFLCFFFLLFFAKMIDI